MAEDPPAGNVPGARFPLHRVVGALTRLLALELVGKRRQRQHDLVGGGVERALPILEIKPGRRSNSAPESSACSCAQHNRVRRSSPSTSQHDLGADTGHV
jgi:hypothetical protein